MPTEKTDEKIQEELPQEVSDELNEKDSFEEIRKVGADSGEDMDSPRFYSSKKETDYQIVSKKSSKKTLILISALVLIFLVGAGVFFRSQINVFLKGAEEKLQPTPTPEPTVVPTPTVEPHIRSDWSLEVLNGSGVSGLAKKVAEKLIELGYPVVKTGNADNQSYEATQILVKTELLEKVDLVVADLKDAVKIASMAGELKEGTASARIIIGKDYNN